MKGFCSRSLQSFHIICLSEDRRNRFFLSPGLSYLCPHTNWMVLYQVVHESSEQGPCDPGSVFSATPSKMMILRMKFEELNGLGE